MNCKGKLDAIGAANKWLRTSLAKERGHYVGERDVALLLRPAENPRPGREWIAVLYTAENPETPRTRRTPTSPEWQGTHWRAALTSAVDTSWFMFEDIFGNEVIP